MIIRLPFPDSALMPNKMRGSFHKTQPAKAAAREAGYIAAKQAGTYLAPEGHIPLSLLYLMPDKRKRDMDNLLAASKWMLDGMAKGLGIDDSRFKPVLIDWQAGPKGGALIAAIGVNIVSFQNVGEC